MGLDEKHHLKLKKTLISAYDAKEKAEVGDLWQTDAMRRIRQIGPLESSALYLMNLERLLWRFAPVACALILVFFVCLLNLDFSQQYEAVKLFYDDPVEYAFVNSFGI